MKTITEEEFDKFVEELKNEFRGRHSVKLVKEIEETIDRLKGEMGK